MQIEFSESFRDIPEKELHITRKDVIRTVTNPLRKQLILFDGLEILLFIQKESKPATSYLLVMGQRKDNTLYVRSTCFRILPDLIEQVRTDEPIILLQQLALSFGIPLRIGEHVGKFFFRENIPIPKDFQQLKLVEIVKPEKQDANIISSMYVRLKENFVDCAIVFSVELNSYLSWLMGKEKIQLSPVVYDVYIAYKRKTAEDFAVFLKECLTEQGFRAFLDLTDIPKEPEGTAKWSNVRDEAIKNSKRFLLIITIGIENSDEVAKELFLARQIPNMKFMYLRHKDLQPKITIKYGIEKIELGEYNQVEFGTEQDLARKVLKILQSSDEKN